MRFITPRPATSLLDRFGAHLLGYDARTGEELAVPDFAKAIAPDWRDITQDPRKYGFHATLKAPMQLAFGSTEVEVLAACAAFAEKPRRIPVITPVVNAISGFIAVVPSERSSDLEQLAADCVSEFDRFRAPLTPRGSGAEEPNSAHATAARVSRQMGIPLRHGRISLPPDVDRQARRGAPRQQF